MKRNFFVPDYLQHLLTGLENGLQGICDQLSNLLAFPIIVIDPLYNQLASTPLENSMVVEYIDHVGSELVVDQSNIYKCQLACNQNPLSGICSAIISDGRLRGYIIIACGEISDEKLGQLNSIITYATTLCSFEFQKKILIKQERQHLKEAFIYDLLYGNIKQKEEIISYGQVWGWDFNHPHTVIVFSLKDFEYYSEDQHLLELLFYTIEKSLVEKNLKPIAMKKRGEIIVIYPLQESVRIKKREEVNSFVSHIINQVEKTNLSVRIVTGVGRECTNPEMLFRSYQESKVAFELGLLLNISTPYFNDLGIERILYKHDLQDLKEYYFHILGEIEEFDRVHGGELMNTLEAFSVNQYDLSKTADAMFLHRNTLRYRFKKIEEILDKKLDDMNVKLDIAAALKIKQLRKF
ncbi:helix-turn-helix domain-containing protein [Bacillus sp. Bva_UNVM-123]|uniref:PucR family transcriptional regulator n=1 Tax=Bacillus sp. Bva_UNVM-123 TaxID=2829798 RepID=UPI00391F9B7F